MRMSFVELNSMSFTVLSTLMLLLRCLCVRVCVCVRAPWSSCFWVREIVDDDPWGGILCSWWGVGSVGRGRTGSTCRRSTPFAAA
jgi:hypothetical protein